MEQLELHGQLAWVNILAAKEGNIQARRSSRRICSLEHVWGGRFCLSYPRTCDCFVNLGTNRFNITANIASADICGRMKELVVPLVEVFAFQRSKSNCRFYQYGGKGAGGEVQKHETTLPRIENVARSTAHTCRNGIVFLVFLEFVTALFYEILTFCARNNSERKQNTLLALRQSQYSMLNAQCSLSIFCLNIVKENILKYINFVQINTYNISKQIKMDAQSQSIGSLHETTFKPCVILLHLLRKITHYLI